MEEKQGVDVVIAALASAHVEALARAATSSTLEKADVAILDELKGRSNALSPSAHKRLLMCLSGDPVRVNVARESSALLKTNQREEPGLQGGNSIRQFRRQRPYVCPYSPINCYRCVYQGISPEIEASAAAAETLNVSMM